MQKRRKVDVGSKKEKKEREKNRWSMLRSASFVLLIKESRLHIRITGECAGRFVMSVNFYNAGCTGECKTGARGRAEAKFESCRIKLQRLKVMQTVKSRNLFAGRTENLHSNRVRGITRDSIEFAY